MARSSLHRRTGIWSALLLGVALTACAQSVDPPGEIEDTPPGTPAFSKESLLRDVRVLAADSLEGRRTGTDGGRKARRYLVRRFEAIGLDAPTPGYLQPFGFVGYDGNLLDAANVIGRVAGRDSLAGILVVTAHYDHLGNDHGEIYNGADDNASGVAALLALAETVVRSPLRHEVIFAALDAEEMGLQGAQTLLSESPIDTSRFLLNLNLDMVSRSERGELYAAGTAWYPALRAPLERVARHAPVTLILGHDRRDTPGLDDWTMQSDHGVFHLAGIPFIYLGVEDHADYHRPEDDFERITVPFFLAAVETAHLVLVELDGAIIDRPSP